MVICAGNAFSALSSRREMEKKREIYLWLREQVPAGVLFCIVLFWLSINFFAAQQLDEVSQVNQWLLFCTRGFYVLLTIALFMLFLHKRVEDLVRAISWAIIVMGVVESVTAMMQLYGVSISNNGIYRETGSFYNPGPLGGYLAVCIPVTIAMWLTSEKRWVRNMVIASLALMIMTEPSTMSRSGWISAVVGSLYVVAFTTNFRSYLSKVSKQRVVIATVFLLVLAVASAIGIWHIKSESAFGRLFLWKISCRAVMEAPLMGSSVFDAAYGRAQESYFATGGTEKEMLVAGTPDYAFNEYLHYAIEWGVPMMFLILMVVVLAVVVGHRQRRYGLCGGIIALAVFSFSSYPMHIPAFVAIAIIMMTGCTVSEGRRRYLLCSVLIIAGVFLWTRQAEYESRKQAMKKWGDIKYLYDSKRFKQASQQYEKLYDDMKWNGRFLYGYGHSLNSINEYEKSNIVLEEAINHSCNSMILNIMGKNYQALGDFKRAEESFLRSLNRLPERIYPHYLLFLLYSEEECYDEESRQREADIILNHKWKIESDATKEIKEKVLKQITR